MVPCKKELCHPLIVELLQAFLLQHTRQDSTSARIVDSMVTSAVQKTVNRSMDDPLLLAAELARSLPGGTASGVSVASCASVGSVVSGGPGVSAIRSVVKLYKARTSLTPALRLHRSTEEATVRPRDRSRFAERSISLLSRIIFKAGVGYPGQSHLTGSWRMHS